MNHLLIEQNRNKLTTKQMAVILFLFVVSRIKEDLCRF